MSTRQKVAAKHVNVMDRVKEVRQDPRPPFTVIQKVGEDIDLAVSVKEPWFGSAMDEFDDRTLGDLVGSGLLGQ